MKGKNMLLAGILLLGSNLAKYIRNKITLRKNVINIVTIRL